MGWPADHPAHADLYFTSALVKQI